MQDLNSIKAVLNQGYDQFRDYGLNKTLEQINSGQANQLQTLGAAQAAGQQSLGSQESALMGKLANARNDISSRTAQAKQGVGQSITNALQSFGGSPQTVGQDMGQAYQGYEPAIAQMQNRAMGQVGSVGNQINQGFQRQEQDVGTEYDDYMQRLEGWRKQKESETISHYNQQRMAIEREKAGSQLERQLMLANLAASLNSGLGNIRSAFTTAANNPGV